MKIHSTKTIMSLLSVAALTISTSAFAHHHKSSSSHHKHSKSHHSSHEEHLCQSKSTVNDLTENADEGLHSFFGAGQNVLTSWGAAVNPDPETNTFLEGVIVSNTSVAETGTALVVNSLRSLGVREHYLTRIHNEFDAYFAALLAYAECVNEENVSVVVPPTAILISCQEQTYEALVSAATALGHSLAEISEYPGFVGMLQNQAVLQATAVQAARGVLVSDIANPSDPTSEAVALTALGVEVHANAEQIGELLIKRVAHEQCEKILRS